jgi:hypothetical protein
VGIVAVAGDVVARGADFGGDGAGPGKGQVPAGGGFRVGTPSRGAFLEPVFAEFGMDAVDYFGDAVRLACRGGGHFWLRWGPRRCELFCRQILPAAGDTRDGCNTRVACVAMQVPTQGEGTGAPFYRCIPARPT